MAEDKKTMEDQLNLSKQLERSLKKQRGLQGQINLGKAEQVDLFEKQIDIEKKFQKFAKENSEFLEKNLDAAG